MHTGCKCWEIMVLGLFQKNGPDKLEFLEKEGQIGLGFIEFLIGYNYNMDRVGLIRVGLFMAGLFRVGLFSLGLMRISLFKYLFLSSPCIYDSDQKNLNPNIPDPMLRRK